MRTLRITAVVVIVGTLATAAVYAALQAAAVRSQSSLAEYAPPGALMALESPDFAALLAAWNQSPKQRRWLAGDDYAAFSRSRLFGRLGEAQSEFATAAGLAPDAKFVEQIAGTQSVFAWYDIGNLEFVYITRLTPQQAAAMPLLAVQDKFEQRQAGGITFYVRTTADAASVAPAQGNAAPSGDPDSTHPRTVAFALHGDLLILATRDDLVASALEQMAHPGESSLATDHWYAATVAVANEKPGDLRLTLNLAKITRSPYFRSYWIQQNITAMRKYSAVLSDLYREPSDLREERFLLPASTTNADTDADLAAVLKFLPPGVVYRAAANPGPAEALAEIEDKLLVRSASTFPTPSVAPSASLTVPVAGEASDLDDRIDTPQAAADSQTQPFARIQSLLQTNVPLTMLSFSTAQQTNPQEPAAGISATSRSFLVMNAGIALASAIPCDSSAWRTALTAALSPRISVDDAGLAWQEESGAAGTWFRLSGRYSLAFATRGNACLIASDPQTLNSMLFSGSVRFGHQSSASIISGFNHAVQRGPLMRLVAMLDKSTGRNASADGSSKPPFFSGNMASLSDTFEDLNSETFVEFQPSPTLTRQTVTYRFQPSGPPR